MFLYSFPMNVMFRNFTISILAKMKRLIQKNITFRQKNSKLNKKSQSYLLCEIDKIKWLGFFKREEMIRTFDQKINIVNEDEHV